MNQAVKVKNEKLMASIPFTDDDLATNRRFEITANQKMRLKAKIELYIFFSFFGTAICFVIGFIALIVNIDSTNLFIMKILGIVGFGVFFYWAVLSISWNQRLRKNRGVKLAEGTAELSIKYMSNYPSSSYDNEKIPHYFMKVGKVNFEIDEETFDSIKGKQFRIYYFQLLKKEILSIENID
ncbi:MAG TPA: hypothetical protein VNB22_03815 [Pyrinomonadaceae bacterium]|nr:hypothetical protein [Pyrinomonadaceae bacterium]